jgi:Kef-type K+ transport system membrane component KefB
LPGSEPIQLTVSGGGLFSLLVLLVAAQLAGWPASLLHVPPLLGMLLAGILMQNLPGVGPLLGQFSYGRRTVISSVADPGSTSFLTTRVRYGYNFSGSRL